MGISLDLNESEPLSPKVDLNGDDELKEELRLFLDIGVGASLNGFNVYFLSKFVFDSEFGHHRWDFTFKEEYDNNDYGGKDWDGLGALNLAWDCWLIAKGLRLH